MVTKLEAPSWRHWINSEYGGRRYCYVIASSISLAFMPYDTQIKTNCQHINRKVGDREKLTSTETTNNLSESALNNLEEIEIEIETSSAYFKPKPGKTYIIRIDPQNKIEIVQTDRFKDPKGNPLKRYEFKIAHVNNGKEQLWGTSKTVCTQIFTELKKGFSVLKVTRNGSDRNTTYTIEGVE